MSDHVVVNANEIEASHGVFRPLTDPLGVTGFRVNRLDLSAGKEGPVHDHTGDGQEEVYAVIGGSGTLRAGGEEIALVPGHFVFCPPGVSRQMVAGDDGLVWIGIGSVPAAGSPPS